MVSLKEFQDLTLAYTQSSDLNPCSGFTLFQRSWLKNLHCVISCSLNR